MLINTTNYSGNSNKTSVGFALVGCGHISQKHCSAILNHVENARLVAVCDVAASKAQAVGEKYSVPWFTNVHEMMDKMGADIDVVNILTPSGYHCQNVLELVAYKKHLCVEKPLALTLEDADAMIKACDEAGIHLFVIKQNRFNLPIQKLKSAIDQGRFGKLVMGSVKVRWCRPQDYYDSANWRGTWALDGGVFANQAVHFADLLQWLMGDVQSVIAKGATRLANIETEDTGVALCKFHCGALGVIEATTAARPKNLEGSLTILGEYGTVEIGGFSADKIRTWKFINPQPEDEEILTNGCENSSIDAFGHVQYLRSVVKTITESEPPAIDGKAGRQSLELITAIYESIATGKEIELGNIYNQSLLGQNSIAAYSTPSTKMKMNHYEPAVLLETK